MDFELLTIGERKIIIGIDFGTTYSGVAWAETQRPDRRIAITSWPISETNREGESSDKVPTKVRYAPGGALQWGFSIPINAPEDEIQEWFKLDLDPSLREMNDGIKDAVQRGRDADKLVTDYLSALGDHLQYTLREKLGEGVVNNTHLEFVVTVPAIWSDLAKDRTRQACLRAAGLCASKFPIHLVSEPEAAAIYALHGLDPHHLKIGESFVICDAGGGTVDLISYTITNLKPILEVQEATAGTGAMCGSSFLNLRFAKFLKAKLGRQPGFDDDILAEAMDRFEKITYIVPVGGLPNNKELGINRGRYSLKALDLQTIFEPVVLKVISLVKEQIASSKVPIRAVLLVGGFGASNFLKERLRNAIEDNIVIMQPPNAWLAVVQGAVMKGLAQSAPETLTVVKVQNRKARKHYGIEWQVGYDDRIHSALKDRKFWDGLGGIWRVSVMKWFIKKGELVSENTPYFHSFDLTPLVSSGRLRKVSTLVYTDRTLRDAPMVKDNSVSGLVRVEADISHIPEASMARRKGVDGLMYYSLSCKIEAVYLSASTQYTLLYNGERYTTVSAEYV
ncbi:hypothetical protein B0T17DRAFT_483713 [Bombardia bombarda]|uniref:Actin-like ATPase domain-containing protein n=1 Tax=Bombardia bombarda TaxID=252184 RepID=A0AA39XI14_9PEZI|nr:hypothetical protein B0T17DRAFT_483713 [Bombardia bombarda]